jgi:hypothetical protein
MWGKGTLYTLLVGMKISMTIIQCGGPPKLLNIELLHEPAIQLLGMNVKELGASAHACNPTTQEAEIKRISF